LRRGHGLAHRQSQFLADRLQQLHRIQPRIQHQRGVGVLGQPVQQQPAERGLAGADFAGELHEAAAAALLDAVEQMRQRVPMVFAEEHVMRVGRDRERRLFEAVVLQVHAYSAGYFLDSSPDCVAPGARLVAHAAASNPHTARST
jgi:hypothetical protein